VATVLVVVADVGSHEADEVALAEYHHMLEKLATAATDPAFGDGILPGLR